MMLSFRGRNQFQNMCRVYGIPALVERFNSSKAVDEALAVQLAEIGHKGRHNAHYRALIRSTVQRASKDSSVVDQAKEKHIEGRNWDKYCFSYRRKITKDPLLIFSSKEIKPFMAIIDRILNADAHILVDEELQALINHSMLKTVEVDMHDIIASARTLLSCSDLRIPHEWYPRARLMKRKIIYHGGPTNSGKTYHALKRLREADPAKGGGLYCGPLRLLALEVYENMNRQGIYCNLITGQERRMLDFNTHTSCTVEVASVHTPYDVAVVDEIQMIADKSRGFAWTRAILGLCANEIHVCGGIEAAEIVKKIAETTGDTFELKTYNRLSELRVQDSSLKGDYSQIRRGDCVVAFSKADIFSIRREIERVTEHKCCVVYGELPPETRSNQARLFNEEGTGYDVLVASDAIGMGLNLNIRRIVFHTTVKPGYGAKGKGQAAHIEPTAIKQIAGRAGRLSSQYDYGEVTTWQEQDLAYLKAVIDEPIPQIKAAGIFPSVEQIDVFSRHLFSSSQAAVEAEEEEDEPFEAPADEIVEDILDKVELSSEEDTQQEVSNELSIENARLSTVVERFVELSRTSGQYFLCDHDPLIIAANWLHPIPLQLTDRFVFGNAPVSLRDGLSPMMLYHYAALYALGRPVSLHIRFTGGAPKNVMELSRLCAKHNVLDLYLWLANRYPKYFVERDRCLEMKERALEIIQGTLHRKRMLQHQYSHSENYRFLRERLAKSAGNPANQLPEKIRLRMAEYLGDIDPSLWMEFPNESHSGEEKKPPQQFSQSQQHTKQSGRMQKNDKRHSRGQYRDNQSSNNRRKKDKQNQQKSREHADERVRKVFSPAGNAKVVRSQDGRKLQVRRVKE